MPLSSSSLQALAPSRLLTEAHRQSHIVEGHQGRSTVLNVGRTGAGVYSC